MLCSIILTFALRPFLEGYFRITFITDIFFSIVLMSGIYAAANRKSTLAFSLLIGIPALVLGWTAYLSDAPVLKRLSTILFALFFSFALVVILSHVLRQKKVTPDVIMGAASVYFLMGVSWAFIFLFLETSHAGSFSFAAGRLKELDDFLYFSLVTLTTTGYGDITPVSSAARSLAVLEAVIGQLYMAVTIARLVGIQISQTQQKKEE
jgi:Ion channel